MERLKERGVETLGRLAGMSDASLAESFGERLGPQLGRLARFEDDRQLETSRVRKSESRETTFDSDLRGVDALEPVLERLTAQLCEDLARHNRRGRTVAIKVRLDDFSTHTRARTLLQPVTEAEAVLPVARELLRRLDPPRPVRLLGVRVAGLDEGRAPAARHQDGGAQLELVV